MRPAASGLPTLPYRFLNSFIMACGPRAACGPPPGKYQPLSTSELGTQMTWRAKCGPRPAVCPPCLNEAHKLIHYGVWPTGRTQTTWRAKYGPWPAVCPPIIQMHYGVWPAGRMWPTPWANINRHAIRR